MKHRIIKPEILLQPTQGGREGKKFTCILTDLKLFMPQGTKCQLKDMPWHASLMSVMSINK